MPGLYGIGANVTVNSSNTTGLYAVANTGNVYSGNISSSNTTGLYIGAGTPTFLNNAELLLLLLDNNGNVNFALDPPTNNSTVYSYFVGNIDVYSNTNVAAFLPGYTGTLDNSSTIINLLANAGTQATQINTLNANLGAFETYANITFGQAVYGNANVAAYLPINSSNVAGAFFIGDGSQLTNLPTGTFYSNTNVAAYLPTYTGSLDLSSSIIALYANAATQSIDIGTLFTNQTILQNELISANANIAALNANVGAFETYANLEFSALNANLGAFEIYANATFGIATYSNANVTAYLPTYTGSLDNSSSVINLYSNAASQQTQIDSLFSNAAGQQTQITTLFANAATQSIDIGTLFTNQNTLQNEIIAANLNIDAVNANVTAANLVIAGLESNAAVQAVEINNINANVTAANLVIAGLESNAATQAIEINAINANVTAANLNIDTINANVFAANLNIDIINANLGAFETYVNATFSTSTYSNANVAAYLPTHVGNIGANAITNTANISIITNAPQNTFVQTTDYTYGDIAITNDGLGAQYLHFINPVPAISNLLGVGDAVTYDIGGGNTNNIIAGPLQDFPGNPNPGTGGFLLATNYGSSGLVNSITVPPSKQWTFTLGGDIVFPDGTVQTTAPVQTTPYGNANVAAYLPTYTGNVGNVGNTANFGYFNTISGNDVTLLNIKNATGVQVLAGQGASSLFVGDAITATDLDLYGNLYARNTILTTNGIFWANGDPFAPPTYSNVDVAAYLPEYTGNIGNEINSANFGYFNTISAASGIVPLTILGSSTGINMRAGTGGASLFVGQVGAPTDLDLNGNLYARDSILITNGVFWANGDPYAPATYGNAQVAEYLPDYTGSLENSSSIINLWANAATQQTQIDTLDANVGAFETYANLTFGPSATGFYSNANVAAYLPIYGGNILATVITAPQPYIQKIGSNNNNSVTEIIGGNNVIISANAGPAYTNAGGIQIVAGNTEVASSGTFNAQASKYFFDGHDGADVSDYFKVYMPAAVYGQAYPTSTAFGANTFSVYDGNVYIGPNQHNVAGSGILRVTNRILVNDGGVSLIGNTISTVGVITSGGNVSAPYFIGDGSQLTNVAASYGNTQVAAYLPTYTGNIGNVSMRSGRRYIYSGNIDLVANSSAGGSVIRIHAASTANFSDGDILVQSEYVGIGSTVSTACVEIFSPTTITQNNATTGNVLFVNGNIVADTGAFGGGRVYATYFVGDGGLLTNVATSYGNTQVAAYLPTYTGNIGATITDGTQPYIYDIGSILNATSVRGAGVSILGTGSNITLNTGNASAYVNNIIGRFRSTTNVEVASGAFFIGDGSKLSGISSSYGNTEVAAYLPTFSGSLGGTLTTAAQPNITSVGTLSALTVTGNVSTGNVSGTKGTFTTVQGTLITAAQTNITSVGTLGAVTVTGAATVGNVITTNGVFWSNGVAYSSGGGGGSYGNVEVAAYLPTYTGALAYTSQTANVNYNNQYVTNAILGTTREKTIALGVIQGTVTIDANAGPIQTATVTANITINTNNLTNLEVGESVTLVLTQNTNANLRVLTSNIKFAAGSKLLSTANAAIDTITIVYDGTNYLASLVKGYA